jgi:hypothetical protein
MENIRSQPVMKTITDILPSEHHQELIQGSVGILANLCQNDQVRQLFVDSSNSEFVLRALDLAQQVIASTIDPFSTALELALIFMHNFSLHETVADFMRRHEVTVTLIVALEQFEKNVNLFDAIITMMNTLYHFENDLPYLAPTDRARQLLPPCN